MMTELQQKRARALSHCRLPFYGPMRDFVRTMVLMAENPEFALVSPNQIKALEGYCWKFREQLRNRGHADLVPERDPYVAPAPVPAVSQEEFRL